jgi:hypothetical protein
VQCISCLSEEKPRKRLRSILKRRTDLEQATNQKSAFDGIRQIFWADLSSKPRPRCRS